MSIEVEIYEKIRYLHEHEGKSQRDISKLLGISRNTVKKYCEGSQVPWERQGISGRQRYVVTDETNEKAKETYWESLKDLPFDTVMIKAREVYKFFEGPCELNLLNPRIYRGEIPNPGIFGRVYCDLLC